MLENLQITFDPLGFIGVLITACITIYTFKAGIPFSYLQERHEKLIFPLFDCLEPALYQAQGISHMDAAISIIENNKSMADGKLLGIYHDCVVHPSMSSYLDLCSYADQAYDLSCRKLKLKRRSIEYRLERKQYRNSRRLVLYILQWSIPSLITFIAVVSTRLMIASVLLHLFERASVWWQLIIIGTLCPLLQKFVERLSE